MPWDYLLMDVFTDVPFGGNQLAVFLDAGNIPNAAMPPIARELNLPETTFVTAVPEDPHGWRVRILTPAAELPFAGHPTIGTAAALVHAGMVPVSGDRVRVTLHEGLGPVPVDVALSGGQVVGATLSTPRPPDVREAEASREELAAMLGLSADDVLDGDWRPRAVGWETAFHVVPLRGLADARRADCDGMSGKNSSAQRGRRRSTSSRPRRRGPAARCTCGCSRPPWASRKTPRRARPPPRWPGSWPPPGASRTVPPGG